MAINYGTSGIGEFLGGLFGDSGAPYEAASKQLSQYGNEAASFQNPFMQMGTSAIGPYNAWLKSMSNPSGFINNLMNQYQQSPWARYAQQQNINAANNLGSATGLTGSTPLQLQAQQNAQNLSSQDMTNWLSNVLGINTEYGQGYGNLISGGQNAANALTNLFSMLGQGQAGLAYGQEAGENQDFGNMIGGALNLFGL